MATTGQPTMLTLEQQRALLKGLAATEISRDPIDGQVRYFRGAIYGEPGCGKSILAAKLGDPTKRAIYFDAENGSEVFMEDRWKDLRAKTKFYPFPGIREITYLIPHYEKDENVDTIIIDSFTTATDWEMRDILLHAGFKRADNPGGLESYTEQDYGLVLSRWKWLLDAAAKSDLNFVLICHVKEPTEKELANGQKRRVDGSNNQANAVTARLGNVVFMEERVDKELGHIRTVRSKTDGKVVSKNRMDLPELRTDEQFVNFVHQWRHGFPQS